ncbi:MAG: response regulator [Candidatus Omnitrophica bacterium]|nr:response regulator [Candidatus Omnitrophota bacterium]
MTKTILVADDDRTLVHGVTKFLQDGGFRVLQAYDGDEALAHIERERPDLIILDIQMPKMSGYSFIFELKKHGHGAHVPIIVLTSRDSMEEIFRAEGVQDYIVKPITHKDLLLKVHQYVKPY